MILEQWDDIGFLDGLRELYEDLYDNRLWGLYCSQSPHFETPMTYEQWKQEIAPKPPQDLMRDSEVKEVVNIGEEILKGFTPDS